MKISLLLTLATMAAFAGGAQQMVPMLINVTVIDQKGEAVRVTRLATTTREYLFQKAPETRTNQNLSVSAHVDCSGKQSSFSFLFFGKVGEKEYHVTLDSKGRLKEYRAHDYEEGMRRELKPAGNPEK